MRSQKFPLKMRTIISDQYALFFLIFWILWTFFLIFNFYLFFTYRTSIYIRNRDPLLIFCSAIGQYAMMTSLSWKIILLPANFPNIINHWFVWLFIPLHLLPYPVRSMRFIIQHEYNKYQYKKQIENSQNNVNNNIDEENGKKNSFLDFLRKHSVLRKDITYFIFNWILMAISIIWGIIRNITHKENWPGRYGIDHSRTYYLSCIALLFVASIFLWIAVHFLRKTDEELYFTTELTTIGILWLVFISLYIALDWLKIGSFRTPAIFLIVLCISSFCVSFGMPVQLAVSVKKKKIDKKDYKDIQKVMNDQKAYQLLVDFCEKKMCLEFILFYKDVDAYKRLKADDLYDKYVEMKEKYVVENAPFHINVLGSVLKKVENATYPVGLDVFNEMVSKVNYMINVEIFPPFKNSPAFKEFMKNNRINDITSRE